MNCNRCGGPVHYQPEDVDSAYGQALHLCQAFPACRGVARTGPSDTDIYRREQPASAPSRVRTVDEQLIGGDA